VNRSPDKRWSCRWRLATVIVGFAAASSFAAAQNRDEGGSIANVPPNLPVARETTPPGSPAGSGAKATERLREGTRLVDRTGTLVSIGTDSVTFSPDGSKDSYRVLENLALQRVVQVLDGNRGPRKWIVSGMITEYRGSNYLLLTKAVFQQYDGDSAAGQ
jgi:hypothetical protein